MKRNSNVMLAALLLVVIPALWVFAAAISGDDSTQPRGSAVGNTSQGNSLDPINDGFRAPARFDSDLMPAENHPNPYKDWVGGMMANAMRDPGFLATLNVANEDLINFIKSLSDADLAAFLAANNLDFDLYRDARGAFQCLSAECFQADSPEDLLPTAADLCLRCHTPAGWMEGHSEPVTSAAPFLKGQFWGAAFLEEPVDGTGTPKAFDITVESEAEMEGVQCDFCHRAKNNFKRNSRYDNTTMSNGNGGFFVEVDNPFDGLDGAPGFGPNEAFQKSSELCGTCHDVTNPFIKTATEVNGAVPDMFHPIERTYTEWFWSGYRGTKDCITCHRVMRFTGAQSWLLSPGLDMLWGDVDQKWIDRGILDPATYSPKDQALASAAAENQQFIQSAANVRFNSGTNNVTAGNFAAVAVRVTNQTGHKLPTGYAEGRQMWLHITAEDDNGVIFEDGYLAPNGSLVRSGQTKVYEQKIVADGYPFISPGDEEFHFVLMNHVEKDNRIPPKGYNKDAYQADGAFIIPENTYMDGQHWDDTAYTFQVPLSTAGNVVVTATLYYQTFNKEYIEFLDSHDTEPTVTDGGRARDLPAAGMYAAAATWGEALHDLWEDVGMGPPVMVGMDTFEIQIQPAPPQQNQRPLAVDDNAVVARGGRIDILVNDYDLDGTIDPATVTIVDAPLYGLVRYNGNGAVTYKRRDRSMVADSFSYRVQDNNGALSLRETAGGTVLDEATVVTITVQ